MNHSFVKRCPRLPQFHFYSAICQKSYHGYYLFTIFVDMITIFGRPKYGLSLVWMRPQIPKPRNSQ